MKRINKTMDSVFIYNRNNNKEVFIKDKNGTGYEFWLLHGVNFIVADPDDNYEPLFPEIYDGGVVNRDRSFTRIINLCIDEYNRLSPTGARAILWMSLKKEEMYCVVEVVIKAVGKRGGNAYKPGDPLTHRAMSIVADTIFGSCDGWHRDKEPWDMEGFLLSAPGMINRSLLVSLMEFL